MKPYLPQVLALAAIAGLPVLPSAGAAAQPGESGFLYADGAGRSEDWTEPRLVTECRGQVAIFNTSEPRYDLYPDCNIRSK